MYQGDDARVKEDRGCGGGWYGGSGGSEGYWGGGEGVGGSGGYDCDGDSGGYDGGHGRDIVDYDLDRGGGGEGYDYGEPTNDFRSSKGTMKVIWGP